VEVSPLGQKKNKLVRQISNRIAFGRQIYQTHAFVIRRTIIPHVQRLLKSGKAADAALVSWSRRQVERCFIFSPQQLMKQPGGPNRWKDSDIFVQGEYYKKASAKLTGGSYSFIPDRKDKRRVPPAPSNAPWARSGTPSSTSMQNAHVSSEDEAVKIILASLQDENLCLPGLGKGVREMLVAVVPMVTTTPELCNPLQDTALRTISEALAEIETSALCCVRMCSVGLQAAICAAGDRFLSRALRAAYALADKEDEAQLQPDSRAAFSMFVACALEHSLHLQSGCAKAMELALCMSPETRGPFEVDLCNSAITSLEAVCHAETSMRLSHILLPEVLVLQELTETLKTATSWLDKAEAAIHALEFLKRSTRGRVQSDWEGHETQCLQAGDQAVLHDVQAHPSLNGQTVKVLCWSSKGQKWLCRMRSGRYIHVPMLQLLPVARVAREAHVMQTNVQHWYSSHDLVCQRRRWTHLRVQAASSLMHDDLAKLTVSQLRTTASSHGVSPRDLSFCLEKSDIIGCILRASRQ